MFFHFDFVFFVINLLYKMRETPSTISWIMYVLSFLFIFWGKQVRDKNNAHVLLVYGLKQSQALFH